MTTFWLTLTIRSSSQPRSMVKNGRILIKFTGMVVNGLFDQILDDLGLWGVGHSLGQRSTGGELRSIECYNSSLFM